MSFKPLTKRAPIKMASRSVCEIGVGRVWSMAVLFISFDRSVIDLDEGHRFDAFIGEGEHRGTLRLTSGGNFTLFCRKGAKRLTLKIPLPDGADPTKRKTGYAVEMRASKDGIDIALPSWALPHATPPAPASAPVSRPEPPPFKAPASKPAARPSPGGGVKSVTSSLMGDPPVGRSAKGR